jgi:hypothetical protein
MTAWQWDGEVWRAFNPAAVRWVATEGSLDGGSASNSDAVLIVTVLEPESISTRSFFKLPVGSTATRPGNAELGVTRFNSATRELEFFDGDTWRGLGKKTDAATALALYYYAR